MSTSTTSTNLARQYTSSEMRVMELLGQNVPQELVASAAGVDASRVSQLLADPEFYRQVVEIRLKTLTQHTRRDQKYDEIEDKLVERLDQLLPMMFKPGEVLKAISTINQAKRRGQTGTGEMATKQDVVVLNMPTSIIQQFTVNSNNQVVQAGDQPLVTVQSSNLTKLLESSKHVQPQLPPNG